MSHASELKEKDSFKTLLQSLAQPLETGLKDVGEHPAQRLELSLLWHLPLLYTKSTAKSSSTVLYKLRYQLWPDLVGNIQQHLYTFLVAY